MMKTAREVVLREVEVFRARIAASQKDRDEGKPFTGTLRYVNGPSMMGASTRLQQWDDLIKMQSSGLADAEARLAELDRKA